MQYIALLFGMSFIYQVQAKVDVMIYTYFDKPPFIISQQQRIGLSYDFARALSAHSKDYKYRVLYLPKQRAINAVNTAGVLLWVTPVWVDDSNETKYWWLKDIIAERELYITNDPDLSYKDVSSLFTKQMVGVRGYHYFGLEQHIQNGDISRIDVLNESLIPRMLIKKRGDFGVIGSQNLAFLTRDAPEYKKELYILEGYKKSFQRSILVSKTDIGVKEDIASFILSQAWDVLYNKWLIRH